MLPLAMKMIIWTAHPPRKGEARKRRPSVGEAAVSMGGALGRMIEGQTPGADPECDLKIVDGCWCAGLILWVEKIGWLRGPLGAMRQWIDAGLPRASSPDPAAAG